MLKPLCTVQYSTMRQFHSKEVCCSRKEDRIASKLKVSFYEVKGWRGGISQGYSLQQIGWGKQEAEAEAEAYSWPHNDHTVQYCAVLYPPH